MPQLGPVEILAWVKAGEAAINVGMGVWENVRGSGETVDDAAAAAELDVRFADYTDRIARAKARSGPAQPPVG